MRRVEKKKEQNYDDQSGCYGMHWGSIAETQNYKFTGSAQCIYIRIELGIGYWFTLCFQYQINGGEEAKKKNPPNGKWSSNSKYQKYWKDMYVWLK